MKYGVVQGRLKDADKNEYELAAELGFDGVELVFSAGNHEQNPLWTDERVAEIRAQAADAGVEVPSVCAVYYNQLGLMHEDAAQRETGVQVLLRLIDGCADVGMTNILIANFGAGEIKTAEDEDYVAAAMERCAPKAQERNINLALETTLPAERFRKLVERIDHPFVRIYYDIANPVMWDEKPEEGIEILADHIVQLHVKDRAGDGDPAMLGEGAVNWPAVAEAIHKIGYDGYLVLETPAGIEETKTNFEFIRSQMGS